MLYFNFKLHDDGVLDDKISFCTIINAFVALYCYYQNIKQAIHINCNCIYIQSQNIFPMAQGLKKTASKPKSVAAVKKVESRKLSKGRKVFTAKGRKAVGAKHEIATSKAINKKNEITASARAIGAGKKFFLNELKEKGTKENAKLKRKQTAVEKKTNTLSAKLKESLRKMGKDI